MDESIKNIYDEIVRDPDLFDTLVTKCIKEHPDSTHEDIILYIIKLVEHECAKEADEDKIRRQKAISRERVLSKALDSIPDSGDTITIKSSIKEAALAVSNSSAGYGNKETLSDLLSQYSTTHSLKIKKRRDASDEIGRELKHA